ncbi:HPP family protein [Xenophilus sp. Marseille-Q4582]|uniref:HPP family protein n=1 Tax=Xenophilus sp. Marseille-Q4582 TaxID=2866600 RepID=UPI001CE41005|nr:HPP family protein [Xenophilus sp. Marseille-Q4582]
MSPPPASPSVPRLQRLREAFVSLLPAVLRVDTRERLRATLGAGLGLFFTALLSHALAARAGDMGKVAWLIAPMGASAVLVFAVPASPLAQPWSVIGGNTLSALVGMACVALIPDPALAAAAAVSLAISLMFALRCLHPPGGASALLIVLMQVRDPHFALFPVLGNSLLLVLAGVVYNSLTGRAYPHRQRAAAPAPGQPASRFTSADFDAALAHYNQVLDISRDDLEGLLREAELAAWHRTLGELRCEDVMSRTLVKAEFGTPLSQAWQLLRTHRIKALPVVDRADRLIGIVTLADFMRHSMGEHRSVEGLGQRLRVLLRPSRRTHSRKPEVVGQLMSAAVSTARPEQRVVELIPLFSEAGHHHLPIVDAHGRAVGILTQSDLVRVLSRAAQPG